MKNTFFILAIVALAGAGIATASFVEFQKVSIIEPSVETSASTPNETGATDTRSTKEGFWDFSKDATDTETRPQRTLSEATNQVTEELKVSTEKLQQLLNSYSAEIETLDKKLALWKIMKEGVSISISDYKDTKTGAEAFKLTHSDDASLTELIDFHINLWNLAISIQTEAQSALQSRIEQWGLVQTKLKSELDMALRQGRHLSDEELVIRKNEVASIDATLVSDETNYNVYSDAYTTQIKKIDYIVTFSAEKYKTDLDRQVALDQVRAVQIPIFQTVIAKPLLQPTTVSCETSNPNSFHPTTSCVEYPTMRTFGCTSSYNSYGNKVTSCN